MLRFSLRWLVVIQAEISDRQAEIRSETWVSEGGKESGGVYPPEVQNSKNFRVNLGVFTAYFKNLGVMTLKILKKPPWGQKFGCTTGSQGGSKGAFAPSPDQNFPYKTQEILVHIVIFLWIYKEKSNLPPQTKFLATPLHVYNFFLEIVILPQCEPLVKL